MGHVFNETKTTEMVTETCIQCGVLFAMTSEFKRYRLNNIGTNFWCPNGHGMSYGGKTESQRLREQLEQRAMELNDLRGQKTIAENERLVAFIEVGQTPEAGKERRVPMLQAAIRFASRTHETSTPDVCRGEEMTREEQWKSLIAKMEKWRTQADDFEYPPQPECIDRAIEYSRQAIPILQLPPQSVMPTADGGVAFEWNRGKHNTQLLEFRTDGVMDAINFENNKIVYREEHSKTGIKTTWCIQDSKETLERNDG